MSTSSFRARRRWPAALFIFLLMVAAQAVGQGREAPLQVMRGDGLDRPLLVMSTGTSAPGEAYADGVRFRVAVEGDFRVYQAFHDGVTRKLHVSLDAAPRYAAFDTERSRFELLSPSLRVELEDYGLLNEVIATCGGTGGKAYPMLGFAIVQLPAQENPVDAANAVESLPGVIDARVMIEGPPRVPR